MQANLATPQTEPELALDARTLDDEVHGRARIPAQCLLRLLHGPIVGRFPVDLDDPIAGLESCLLRGTTHERRYDRYPALAHVDLQPDTSVAPSRSLRETRQPFCREID